MTDKAKAGLARGPQPRLAYQPLVDAQSTQILSFEALLRWHDPELGQIPPTKFIPIAEETAVRALGCDKIQGYIFSRPVAGTTVKSMLGQNRKLAAA